MRLAIIKDGFVENVVVADLKFAKAQKWDFVELEDEQRCAIGWAYDGTSFVEPVIVEVIDEAKIS